MQAMGIEIINAGTFARCVSALGRDVPHYRTQCIENSSLKTMLTLSLVRMPNQHKQLAPNWSRTQAILKFN